LITVDDVNLTALDVERWRARVAWVPQSPYLFNTSVAQNIRMGHTTASMSQVIQAVQAAGAHDFISRLPQGYDTPAASAACASAAARSNASRSRAPS